MATQAYTIWAYSRTTGQSIREIELNGHLITDRAQALKRAESFAGILNRDQKLYATDWQPKIKLESLGMDTLGT
jgi:hypothetical protein